MNVSRRYTQSSDENKVMPSADYHFGKHQSSKSNCDKTNYELNETDSSKSKENEEDLDLCYLPVVSNSFNNFQKEKSKTSLLQQKIEKSHTEVISDSCDVSQQTYDFNEPQTSEEDAHFPDGENVNALEENYNRVLSGHNVRSVFSTSHYPISQHSCVRYAHHEMSSHTVTFLHDFHTSSMTLTAPTYYSRMTPIHTCHILPTSNNLEYTRSLTLQHNIQPVRSIPICNDHPSSSTSRGNGLIRNTTFQNHPSDFESGHNGSFVKTPNQTSSRPSAIVTPWRKITKTQQ